MKDALPHVRAGSHPFVFTSNMCVERTKPGLRRDRVQKATKGSTRNLESAFVLTFSPLSCQTRLSMRQSLSEIPHTKMDLVCGPAHSVESQIKAATAACVCGPFMYACVMVTVAANEEPGAKALSTLTSSGRREVIVAKSRRIIDGLAWRNGGRRAGWRYRSK